MSAISAKLPNQMDQEEEDHLLWAVALKNAEEEVVLTVVSEEDAVVIEVTEVVALEEEVATEVEDLDQEKWIPGVTTGKIVGTDLINCKLVKMYIICTILYSVV